MRVLYIDCIGGVAGDMLLGALVDAGANRQRVLDAVAALGVGGWKLEFEETHRGALRATHAKVTVTADDTSRNHREIRSLLDASPLEPGTKERSKAAFEALAQAEAVVHGVDPDEVHFHEVGGLDALVDIVGVSAALEDIAPVRIVASPIPVGSGWVTTAHGELPVPAPASTELLKGAVVTGGGKGETVTPTGAALLRANCDGFGSLPAMRLWATGYGAGTRDTEVPNVVRVLIGDAPSTPVSETIELIETNIDDMSPELLPYVIERVLSAGALDAWTVPAQMKKGRIGTVLSVLVERGGSQAVLDVMFHETTTLGIRISGVEREVLDRKEEEVDVAGHRVRIKVGYRNGEVVTASPEYADAAMVARTTGMPLKEVYRSARAAFEASRG